MTSPDKKMTALCKEVIRLVGAGEHLWALALAYLKVCVVDGSQYANLINTAGMDDRTVKAGAAAIDDAFDANPQKASQLMAAQPLSMLSWLAEQANMLQPAAPHPYRLAGYRDEAFKYSIAPALARSVGFPPYWTSVFIWHDVYGNNMRSRIAMQGLSPQRFAPGWHVIPNVPDQNQRSRTVEVVVGSGAFQADCQAMRRRGQLRIYAVEFTTIPIFLPELCGGDRNYWSAAGLANEEEMIVEAKLHIQRALEMQADVMIFPELTVSPKMKDAITDILATLDGSTIGLVIAGSFHEATGPGEPARNVTYALDRNGDVIQVGTGTLTQGWCHEKQNPVRISTVDGQLTLQENLLPGSKTLLVHTPLGLLAIVNCLDLAQAAATSTLRLELIPTSVLWVPSMSPTTSAHLAHAKTLQLNHATVTVCSNQSAAQFTDEHSINDKAGQSFVLTAADRMLDSAAGYGMARLFVIEL